MDEVGVLAITESYRSAHHGLARSGSGGQLPHLVPEPQDLPGAGPPTARRLWGRCLNHRLPSAHRQEKIGGGMSTPADEIKAVTETARDLAYRQLDAQFQSSDNFDTKALGVLGFDGAAVAAILAAKDLFYHLSWTIPAVLLIISAVVALFSIQSVWWEDGPDPKTFYDRAAGRGVSLGSAAAANVDLISQLGGPHGAIAKNDKKLRGKSRLFVFAIWTTVVAGVASAILIGLSR